MPKSGTPKTQKPGGASKTPNPGAQKTQQPGTQNTQQSGGASKTPNPVSVSGFISLLPALAVLIGNILSSPDESKTLKSAIETAKCAEHEFGPYAVTESAWQTVAQILRKLRRIDEAEVIEKEKCTRRTGSVDLTGLLNTVELDEKGEVTNPERVTSITDRLFKPFYIWTISGYYLLSSEDALGFASIYTALRLDLVQLCAWWKKLGLDKYGDMFEDPSKYDISQASWNTAVKTIGGEYDSMTKRVHAQQLIGCISFEQNNYLKTAVHFWTSLIERVFKSSIYKFGHPNFASHKTVDASEPVTKGKKETLEERHDRFCRDVYCIIEILLTAVDDLKNPQHGSQTVQISVHGSRVMHNLSPECEEHMKKARELIEKVAKTESTNATNYKRSQNQPRDLDGHMKQHKLKLWFLEQMSKVTESRNPTPKPPDTGS